MKRFKILFKVQGIIKILEGKGEKVMKKGKMVFLIIIFGLIFGVNQIMKNPEKYGAVSTSSTSLKEFDSKTWEQYKTIHDAHNKLMEAMYAYGDGKVNKLDFYDYCKEAEDYFRNTSTKFGYGSSDYEKKYLSVFKNLTLYDQLVAKNLMKYLDTSEIKYLSTTREYIQLASDAKSNDCKVIVVNY